MAVYHLSMKTVSRRQGRSAPAAAAYRAGAKLHDARQGRTFDYVRREGVVHTEIRAPEAAPAWMRDRQALWDGAEAAEKRRDAMVARELEISLPRELAAEQQAELAQGFVDEQLVARGLVADVAIHDRDASDGERNPHAHVLFKDRPVEGEGFAGRKDRGFNRPADVDRLRQAWSEHANAALAAAGAETRVDHRSLAAQAAEAAEHRAEAEAQAEAQAEAPDRDPVVAEAEAAEMVLDREPEPKAGPAAKALAERHEDSERWADVERVRQQRSRVQALADSMRQAAQQIRRAVSEMAAQAAVQPEQPQPRGGGDPRVAHTMAIVQQEEPEPSDEPEKEIDHGPDDGVSAPGDEPESPEPEPEEASRDDRDEIERPDDDEPDVEDEEPDGPGM